MTTEDRFYSKVDKTEDCWLWLGGLTSTGYGKFSIGKRDWRAHRAAWLLHYNEDPGSSLILHRCDNPRCVRISHLFKGSNADNMQDRNEKGRQAKGEQNGRSKLNTEVVVKIKKALQTASTYSVAK